MLSFTNTSPSPWVASRRLWASSMRSIHGRSEEAHNRLLATHGLADVFVKLNMDALLRASLKDRYEAYAVGIRNKFVLPNEARAKEDDPPIPGGDEFPVMPGEEASSPSESLTRQLQQIYLAVGSVITSEEAREILNRNGAGLTGPAPQGGDQ